MKSWGRKLEVKRGNCLACMLALVLGLLPGAGLHAQGRFLPDVASFEMPLASQRVSGFAGRIIKLSRGESRFGSETEADVGIGETFPVLALRRGERPITLGFGVEVYGRFSLDNSKTALISNDWVVGFDLHADLRPWELALQVYHESSHLGDEYARIFQAPRLDWTRAVVMAWAGVQAGGGIRVLAGAGVVPRDELKLSPWLGALGVDYRGRSRPLLGLHAAPLVGVFADGASATDWRISLSARAGVALSGDRKGREVSVSLIAYDGLSTQRQFYRNQSRFIGLELGFQL